ncbi:unnamed protein product, partial [marine sediment metagenome]
IRPCLFALRTASDIAARCAADAGLTKALFEMNEKLGVFPWADSNLPQVTDEALPGCDATFSYTVTGDANSGYTVVSIGKSAHAQKQVSSTLRLKGLFEYGLLAKQIVVVEENTLLYGYDSDTGSTDTELTIGTISTAPDSVVLGGGSSIIDGDVFVGAGGDTETVIQNSGTVINGQTYALKKEIPFPVITPPSLPDMGTMDITGTTVIGPADNGKYAGIVLLSTGMLEITGGDVVLHVTGDIVMNGGSQIQVDAGSSLTLYVDGDLAGDVLNNVEINNYTGIAGGFKLCLMGTSEPYIEFVNNSDLFMAIYAPNTDVIFKNNTNFRGSIVAESIYMKNNSLFYYDKALQGESIGSGNIGVSFVIDRWQEG